MVSMPCMVSVVKAQLMILGLWVVVQQQMIKATWKLQQVITQVILQIMPVQFMCVNIMVMPQVVFLGMVAAELYKKP